VDKRGDGNGRETEGRDETKSEGRLRERKCEGRRQ